MKTLKLIALLLIAGVSSQAQRNSFRDLDHERFFRLGVKGGMNINRVNGTSYKTGFNYNYFAGGFLQFNFSNRFGLQPEVSLVQSSSEFADDANDAYNDLFRGGSQKAAKMDYLKVPILLNINVGLSKHVKIQLGPQFGALLKETVDSLKDGGSIYKKASWSAVGGLWIQIPVVNFGARYELGITNLNAVDTRQKWNSQAISLFVGITI